MREVVVATAIGLKFLSARNGWYEILFLISDHIMISGPF